MSYDDLIRKVHGNRFHFKMYIMFFLNGIPNAWVMAALPLILYVPTNHHCSIPLEVSEILNNTTFAIKDTMDYLIPLDEDGGRSQCLRYDMSADDVALFLRNMTYGEYTQNHFENISTISCDRGHSFESPLGIQSAAMEFGWTCDKIWMKPLVSTAYMVGVMVASLSGLLSDNGQPYYPFIRSSMLAWRLAVMASEASLLVVQRVQQASGQPYYPFIRSSMLAWRLAVMASEASLLVVQRVQQARFGRRIIFNSFTALIFVTMFMQSFSTSTLVYAILLFVSGLVCMVNYIVGFVLGVEVTIPEERNFLSISSFLSFSCGYGVSSLIFFLTPDWRWYLRACGMLGILFLPNYWLIPESPRWLMAKGRIEEAKEVLRKIAKCNNKPDDVINKMLDTVEKEAELLVKEELSDSRADSAATTAKIVKEIIKRPAMMRILLVSEFAWFSATIVYYGIALSVQSLSGNILVNNTVMGLVELPGYFLAYLAVKYLSRPKSNGGIMVASGVFCMGAALLHNFSVQAASIAGLIGKSLNCAAFYLVYIHTTEVFPTLARNSCMSLGSFAGRIGSMISPYISYMVDLYGFYTPYILMSTICVASGLLTLLFFPETRNVELPETVDDTLRLKTLYSTCSGKLKPRKMASEEDVPPLNI